jgi:hypothetical protein
MIIENKPDWLNLWYSNKIDFSGPLNLASSKGICYKKWFSFFIQNYLIAP